MSSSSWSDMSQSEGTGSTSSAGYCGRAHIQPQNSAFHFHSENKKGKKAKTFFFFFFFLKRATVPDLIRHNRKKKKKSAFNGSKNVLNRLNDETKQNPGLVLSFVSCCS